MPIENNSSDYYCFKLPIHSKDWNPYQLKMLQAQQPKLVLANEYENSLQDYDDCLYEVQVLL